ncbi:MAG: bifunctional sulfate adenylyltransferase/adenylylsulfate kinase, partial [Acidimicrobiia bacterium]
SESLIQPYGGELVDLMADEGRTASLKEQARDWPSWDLTDRQLCDLELLLNGGFSPLRTFLGKHDYDSVLDSMRLEDKTLWPIPITLDIEKKFADRLSPGTSLALRDPEGVMLAALEVSEVWQPDLGQEAEAVFGTADPAHPGVARLSRKTPPFYVSGRLEGLELPSHYDFALHRHTPAQLRDEFARRGWRQVVAFQTRNPMHRAHVELTTRAATDARANLLIHPVVGMTKPGDIDHYTRVRVYRKILNHYPQHTAMLSLLPLAMRMAGPREALWHAIIRRNHGATHLIVGRDHAGPGGFYGPYDAQELLSAHEDELGVTMVPFRQMVYVEDQDAYQPDDEVPEGSRVLSISGTELRERLSDGREVPEWFTYPEVAEELRRTHPPRHRQGFTVFLTGLSGAGKSTIANVLMVKFLEIGGRPVTLLDGDVVRKELSSELGFSKEHRDLNIRRIGFVASEITKNGGIAICAPIAPYQHTRSQVREMIEEVGGFCLVYVSTPLEVAEQRDRKGLYAKARAGLIEEFTGISDPYEEPADAEVVINTTELSPEQAAQEILLYLEREGYVGPSDLDS